MEVIGQRNITRQRPPVRGNRTEASSKRQQNRAHWQEVAQDGGHCPEECNQTEAAGHSAGKGPMDNGTEAKRKTKWKPMTRKTRQWPLIRGNKTVTTCNNYCDQIGDCSPTLMDIILTYFSESFRPHI